MLLILLPVDVTFTLGSSTSDVFGLSLVFFIPFLLSPNAASLFLSLLFCIEIDGDSLLVDSSESSGILDADVFRWASGNLTGAADARDSNGCPDDR